MAAWQNDPLVGDASGAKPWESDPTEASDGPGASAVIPLATRQNPDAAGKASRMARETGISFDTALRNSPELELRLNTQRAAEAAAKTVTLSRYMADYEFAAKAHDEAERLGAVERTVRGLGGGLLSPLEPTLRGAGEVLGMVQRRGIQGIADLVLPEPMAGGKPTPDSLTGPSVAEGWRAAAAGVGEFSREVTGIDPRAATFYDNVLSGLGQLPTQIALSLATGGTSNFAQGVGIMADKTDKDPNKATGAGDLALLLGGAITMVTEKITERVIPKGLMDGKVLDMSRAATTGRIAIAGGTEFTQEFTENLLHDVTRKALVNPDAPIQIEQSLEEGGVGGVVGAVARTVVESALRIRARNVRANTAEDDATRLQQLMSAVGQLRLLERDRASVADFVQAAAADSDNAPTHLYMDGRTLGEVLDQGGISVDQLKEMLPAVASQLEAVGTNSPVAIPVGELMAALPGTNLEQVFLQNLRSTPEGLSQLEATAAREQTEQLLNQEITRIGGQLAQTQQFMAERDQIQTILADEIVRTGNGGLTQTDAQKSAALTAAGMASVAARLRASGDARFENITPMGLFNLYRMTVADAVPSAQDSLNAAGTKLGQLDNIEGFHFSKAERPVISTAMFGTGLKGSNRDAYANAPDARLRKRAYFYVDKGTGINPEAGVGGIGHKASLSNIYDGDSDPLRLKGRGGQLDFESRVLDAGFSGYLTRMEGGQSGQVILLGDQTVQPEVLGPTGKTQGAVVPAPKPRESRGRDIVTDALKSRTDLPTGALSPARWSEVLSKLMPETHAAMQEAGVFEGRDSMYKSELIKAYEAVTPEPVYAQSVSTRVPTAVKAIENPLEDMLVIGLDAAKADPKAFAKNVELLRGYLNFRDNKSASTPEKAAEQFINHAVDNLLWLFDQVPAETRVRSKLWYDGARAIAEQWAAKYGITEAQAAGMLAVLSPQKDWYQNVSLAERVLDVMSSKQDFAWTAEMDATVVSLPVISEADAAAIRGKTLAQLDSDYLQAIWVRVYDQTYHERGHRIVSPEGQFTEWATNLDGESRSKTAWGPFTEIGKAIAVFKNGDIANISAALGGQHKVRNFYNNIFNPASAHGDVTIDTHAVAAALLRPLAGSATEVLHNFGSGGAASSSLFGAKGTYGIYAEAYRRAAAQRGVLPREMQSITWEAVRGLYTAGFKSQNANVAAVDAVWGQYKKRKASLDDTRKQLLALAGGINPPSWEERPGAPASETPWASSYTEELRPGSGVAGAAGSGARGPGVLAQPGAVNGRDQQAGSGSGRDQGGSLAPLEGAPNVAGAAGPDPRLVVVAEQYARSIGLTLKRQAEYVTVDPERAAKIAAAYEAMAHAPQDPAVKEAYQNLIAQTMAQYRALEAAGYKFFLVDETTDPYAGNPWNAMRDLRANQHMGVFATEAGFGSGGQLNIGLADPAGGANLDPATVLAALQEVGAVAQASEVFTSDTEPTLVVKVKQALTKEQGDRLSTMLGQEAIAQRTDDESGALFGPAADKWGDFNPEFFITIDGTRASEVANPLLADTGLLWPYGSVDGPMKRVLANDLFRAVHDAFGHGLEGSGFRAQGEENAWQAHVRLFTGSAVGAITSETRGQNSWLNYGPYGERNQTAKVEDTVFADQKTGLMPEWTWTEGRVSDEGLTAREEQILNQETQRPGFGPPLRLEDFVRPETLQNVQEALQAYVKGGSTDPLTPEQRAQAEAILAPAQALAEQAKPAFDAAVQEVADSLGGDVKLAGVKGMRRAAEKLVLDSDPGAALSASTIKDFLRATIIVPTMADVPQAVAALQARFKGSRAKDRFAAPPATGYRDVLMNVVTPDGSIAEVQITVPAMLAAKDVGHKLYEIQRALPEGAPEAAEFEALQQALYGEAFAYAEAALASTASAAAMSSGLEGDAAMKNSAEGTGAPLRAQTALPSGSLNTGEPSISKSSAPGGMASGSMFSSNEPIVADSKDLRQGPRGQFQPSTNVVALLAAANKSTFLHESGHFFLEMMADLAGMPNPPQFIADDMAKVLKWFGVKDLAGWQALPFEKKRPLHEKFAEGFEQYLFEGRAPSVELRGIFASFASWLKDIYRTVRDFAKASGNGLNVEVRGVFDRLLATDEEISRVRELETFEAIFKSAEQAGMTPEEWQAYKAQQQAAIDKAMELMQPRVLRDMQWAIGAHNRALAKIRREMAAKRKEIREQVEQEVDNLPQFAAGKALADGQAEFELDPTAADFNAAALADAYGFPSIDAMYSAVEAAVGTRDSVVEALTDQRMLEQEGLLATAKGMETAAAEAVMNEAQAKFVATELLALERAGKQNEKTAAGGTVNVLDRAARDFAKELVGRKGLVEIDPSRFPVPGSRRAAAASMFRAAANRAGALANKALAGGDTAAAAQAKRDQTLNSYAAVEAQKARDEMTGIFEFFARVTKGNEQKLVDKGRDPDIVNAARAVLAAFGVSPRTEKSAREYLEAVKAYDPGLYAVIEPSILAAEQQAKPVGQLTLAELRDLRDEVKALWDLAKRSRQMEVEGNMLDLADAEVQLQQRLEDIGIPDTLPGEEGALTDKEKALRKLQFFLAAATRMESWVERMDGRFGGPFAKLVFGPIKAAANKYRKDKAARVEQFVKLLDGIKPFMGTKAVEATELGYTFGRDGGGAMNEILHALLHTGNASNKRKLLLGRGWATQNADGSLDTTKWDAFVQRMASEGVLKKEHMDFVQGVWDLLEDMKPAAQEAHRTVYGRYFSEITADPVQTPFGEYRGGYAPAQVDTTLVVDGELRKLAEAENENMAFSFPSTNRGFTKGRVEYNRPLKLDLRTLTQHIDKVLLFTHMQPAVTDVNRLVRRKGVSQPLARVEPTAYSGLLTPWLNTAARQAVETPVVGDGGLLRFFTALRGRAGLATMMANVSNTAQQVTGFLGAAAKLKSNGMKPAAIITSMARYVAGPKQFTAQVAAASDYMANRMDSEVAAMQGLMEEVLVNPSLLKRGQAWTSKHAYFMQSAVDNIFSPVVWTAGFNQALEQGMSDADAVRYADNLVRTTQGSSLPEDVSRLETGHPFVRMFSQFMGYTNMLVNTNATALVNTYKEMGFKKGAGQLFFIGVVGYLGQYWVSEAISQAFRGGPDDEDKDGRVLDDWLTAVFGMGTAKAVVSAVPVVNVAGQAVANRFNSNPMDDRISPSPALSLLESAANAPFSVSKAAFGEGSERKAVRDVASLLTLTLGLPIAPLARPASFLAGVESGEVQPTSTADFMRGLTTGAVSPDSKAR